MPPRPSRTRERNGSSDSNTDPGDTPPDAVLLVSPPRTIPTRSSSAPLFCIDPTVDPIDFRDEILWSHDDTSASWLNHPVRTLNTLQFDFSDYSVSDNSDPPRSASNSPKKKPRKTSPKKVTTPKKKVNTPVKNPKSPGKNIGKGKIT